MLSAVVVACTAFAPSGSASHNSDRPERLDAKATRRAEESFPYNLESPAIARGSTPVVRLTRLRAERPARRFGAMRGRARVTQAFFEPLPESELKRWE